MREGDNEPGAEPAAGGGGGGARVEGEALHGCFGRLSATPEKRGGRICVV